MHLLVLSAFRPGQGGLRRGPRQQSQCTFWCSVLSDLREAISTNRFPVSQCTFWCSVLSDVVKGVTIDD